MATPTLADHDQVYAPCDPEDPRPSDEAVWYIEYMSGDMLRFDDPWWAEQANPLIAWMSNWGHQCSLGASGVWQAAPILPLSHPPTYVTETRYPATTTTTSTTTTTTTTTAPPATTTTVPPATTTIATTTTTPTVDLTPIIITVNAVEFRCELVT